ncbi:uncharacterized protein LOC128202340 [Galleria mellonella]|uniref:Uncharacterized protein LOC128202340 n=1 Tax=Galleria mellonella TaxID=7137 RepID=A0ABM3N3W4_GALME|nr:uncharacterized protein LOC128202340 [Galleria mellonella]
MKTDKNMHSKSIEYLSKDIIDEDLLRSFEPIRRLQFIMGSCRVDGRHRFVTAPTLYQRLYSILLLILVLLVNFKLISIIYSIFHNYQALVFTILFETSHYSNLMVYFAMHLRVINRILKNYLKEEFKEDIIDLTVPFSSGYYVKVLFEQIEMKNYDLKSFDVYAYLKKLLSVFSHYQKMYMFQCVKFVVCGVSSFQFILLLVQNNVSVFIQPTIHTSTILVLCLRCELFLNELKLSKQLSISVMSYHMYGPIREKAKKIYKILDETPPTFMVYDMWEMNARLLIQFGKILTGLYVTLLQFAFL